MALGGGYGLGVSPGILVCGHQLAHGGQPGIVRRHRDPDHTIQGYHHLGHEHGVLRVLPWDGYPTCLFGYLDPYPILQYCSTVCLFLNPLHSLTRVVLYYDLSTYLVIKLRSAFIHRSSVEFVNCER